LHRKTWRAPGGLAALLILVTLGAGPGIGQNRRERSRRNRPAPQAPATPPAPAPATQPTTPAPPAPRIQRLVFAPYAYSYQADPRRRIPVQGIRHADGSSALSVHPWEGLGPWFSYDRTQWHKSQLPAMRSAGIDVMLPVFRGDAKSRATHAIKGLDCLAQALKELRQEREQPNMRGRDFPLVGMYFDTSAMAAQLGGIPDLKAEGARRTFYGMVREFFLHIPPEFRAQVALPPERARAQQPVPGSQSSHGFAHVVFLSAPLRNLDPTVLAACSDRFAREFGVPLLWIGGPEFHGRAGGLDGVIGRGSGSGGWIEITTLSPGRDDSASPSGNRLPSVRVAAAGEELPTPSADAPAPTVESRRQGRTYIESWIERLRGYPDWLLLQSWNNSAEGTDIAPSHEYGPQYLDLTRAGASQFRGGVEYAVSILQTNIPPVMSPRVLYQVQVVAQNTGQRGWTGGGFGLSYRWFKDGQPVGDPAPVTNAPYTPPNELRVFNLGLTPPLSKGQPLPEGDYELRLDMTRPVGGWFEAPSALPYVVPVRVTAAAGSADESAPRPYWITSSMPSLAKTGTTYNSLIRLRNDGAAPWRKADGLAIGYRWVRVSSDLNGLATQREERLEASGRVELPVDVLPGAVIAVPVPVRLADDAGKPLPVWTPKEPWCYVLEWDLYDGKRWASEAAAPTRREVVAALADDMGVTVLGTGLANTQPSGNTTTTKVGLRNSGPETWSAATDRLVYHWYFFDGSEARWAGLETKLPNDVKPGETVVVPDVRVQVPDFTGPMYLTLDLKRGQNYASTGTNSRGGDLYVLPVNLVGGAMAPLNLSSLFDTDGISFDTSRGDGNMDGHGHTLPAEGLPPYQWRTPVGAPKLDAAVYPCGLWSSPVSEGDRVPFWYPDKREGGKNMISSAGQRLEFPPGVRAAVHVLATATEPNTSGEATLVYRDGTTTKIPLQVSSWTEGPRNGDHVAFTCLHRHTAAADEPGVRTYLYHYTLRPQRGRFLAALELPNNPAIKVVAVTLEAEKQGDSTLPTLRLPGLLDPK
jgi:hypothetical protein